jgi:hypothetical protein
MYNKCVGKILYRYLSISLVLELIFITLGYVLMVLIHMFVTPIPVAPLMKSH